MKYLILICICLAVYSNAIQGEFVIDDIESIQEHPYIKTHYYIHDLSDACKYLGYKISGMETWGYHLISILLHCTATVLCLRLLRCLCTKESAFIGALVYAVHPVHTEAVSWISGIPYLWQGIFGFSVLNLFIKKKRLWAFVVYALALFNDVRMVVLLPILITYWWLYEKEEKNENKV